MSPNSQASSSSQLTNGVMKPNIEHRPFSDPSRLAPEDAQSPPKKHRDRHDETIDQDPLSSRIAANVRRRREKESRRSRSGRRPNEWKKLLWIKQQCEITQAPC